MTTSLVIRRMAGGNICPVTIILPTIAMEAGRDVDCFMALLDAKIKTAHDMLIERFNYICFSRCFFLRSSCTKTKTMSWLH